MSAPECPTCHGEGRDRHYPNGNKPAEHFTCRTCNGVGFLVSRATQKKLNLPDTTNQEENS